MNQLKLPFAIGLYEHEQNREQLLTLTLELQTSLKGEWSDDCYDHVLCYDRLVREITELRNRGHINLIETLASDILDICLAYEQVEGAKINIEKPEALMNHSEYGQAIVAVELERKKQ